MKKTFIAITTAILLTATGCSTVQNLTSKVKPLVTKGDQAESVTPPKAEDQEIAREASQDYTSPIPADAVAEADSAAVIPDTAEAENSIQLISPALAKAINGEWQITMVGKNPIDRDEDMPYIVFDTEQASFYANNGCNTLNGAFTLTPDSVLTFHNVLSTMRLCQDAAFEHEINVIIADGHPSPIRLSNVGSESYLDFVTGSGKLLMRLRRGNLDFLNGNWDVESIAGLDHLDVPANVFFDLGELKLHGNTGCNYVNGTIYLDHRRSNAVDFSNMITTRMACPYNDQQTAMLVALEQTETALSDGAGKVMFLDENGRNLMTLRRAENQNPED